MPKSTYKIQKQVGSQLVRVAGRPSYMPLEVKTWEDIKYVEFDHALSDEEAIDLLMIEANQHQVMCRLLAAPGVNLTRVLTPIQAWIGDIPRGWQFRAIQNPTNPKD